jgi:hypothetical protein
MTLNFARWLAAFVATICAGAALAQPSAAPVPRYQVEIIVFAHRDFDAGEELFPQNLAPLRADRADALAEVPEFVAEVPPETAGETPAAEGDPSLPAPTEDPLAIRLLSPDEYQLKAEYRKLSTLSAYHPLLHTGWVQPGLPENQAKPFDLGQLGVVNPRGSVRVYLSRFLHVSLDLAYQEAAAPELPSAATAGNDLREVTFARRYRLTAERQVRSGELHYFDHPVFGVLVKITPVPTGNPASTGRRPAA